MEISSLLNFQEVAFWCKWLREERDVYLGVLTVILDFNRLKCAGWEPIWGEHVEVGLHPYRWSSGNLQG